MDQKPQCEILSIETSRRKQMENPILYRGRKVLPEQDSQS